jgi:hypothetical protein
MFWAALANTIEKDPKEQLEPEWIIFDILEDFDTAQNRRLLDRFPPAKLEVSIRRAQHRCARLLDRRSPRGG